MRLKALLWLLSGLALWAQPDPDDARTQYPQYKHPVLKVFPLALVDPFQYTLHVGLEFPMQKSSSLQLEGGWVFGSLDDRQTFNTQQEEYYQQGFKARLQWREYFSEGSPKKPTYTQTGGYFAVQGGFQYYRQMLGRIDTSLFSPNPSPPPDIEYERVISALSLSFLLGYQGQIGQRFVIDFFTGIGARYSQHRWEPLRPSARPLDLTPVGDLIVRPGGRPIVHMGFSMGWILR